METLTEYDKLEGRVISDRRTGRPVMGFAIQTRLFLAGGAQPQTRHAVSDALARFRQLAPSQITHVQPDPDSGPRPIDSGDVAATLRGAVARLDPGQDIYAPHLTSWPAAPPKWQASALLPAGSEGDDAISVFDAAVPPAFLRADPGAYLGAVLDWCEAVQPLHGLAGIAPIYEFGMSRSHMCETWPFLARFPGLHYPLPYTNAAKGHAGRRISGTNWLTILSDGVLAELGGAPALISRLAGAWAAVMDEPPRQGLPPEITLHEYDGGLLIRAGAHPQLGDVNMGNIPEAYRVVNDALRPLRFEDYQQNPMDLIEVPRPLDAYEETLNWLNRFDIEP